MDGESALYYLPLLTRLARPFVALDHIDPFHEHPVARGERGEHFAALATVPPHQNLYLISFFYLHIVLYELRRL